MEKLFEIASSITNPISLTALFFLILYLLFKGVITKVGLQKGDRGFKLLKQLMKTVAVIAIITLILVFGFKAYKVYSNLEEVPIIEDIEAKLDVNQKQINESTDSIIKKTSEIKTQIGKINKEDLTVQLSLSEFTGAELLIGNTGGKIILMKNLKVHWDYSECPRFKAPIVPKVLIVYRYDVNLTADNGDQLIDTKEYSYGAGDIDKFHVQLKYPELGVYTIWFSFEYTFFGSDKWSLYKTGKDNIEKCMKWN